VGVGFNRKRTRERTPDGNHPSRTATPQWLSLALDSELGGADRHQYVALPVVGTVKNLILDPLSVLPANSIGELNSACPEPSIPSTAKEC